MYLKGVLRVMMPHSDDERRISAIEIDEETGEVSLYLPKYEDDEQCTFATVLFMILAHKLTNDEEWCNTLVDEAEAEREEATVH